jgi:hypothetical protein
MMARDLRRIIGCLWEALAVNPYPFVTLVLSAFVAAIAFLQWRTARNRLILDLYNKRFDIYSSVLDLYQTIMKKDDQNDMKAAGIRFIKSFRESQFLFRQKDGIYKTLENIKDAYAKIEGAIDIPDNPHVSESAAQARLDFEPLLLRLERQIDRYLDFRNIK